MTLSQWVSLVVSRALGNLKRRKKGGVTREKEPGRPNKSIAQPRCLRHSCRGSRLGDVLSERGDKTRNWGGGKEVSGAEIRNDGLILT